MSDELDRFVYRALEKGVARERIAAVLRETGWPDEAASKALAAYAEADCPEPVPRPRRYISAADTILHLGVFSSLYIWVSFWIWLLFIFVAVAYPDHAVSRSGVESMRSNLRWAISSLVVAYPLYLWLSQVVRRVLREDAERRRSRVRSWLIWLTLFFTAAALFGDLATLLYRFLDGEMTTRFLLKAAIVGVISAGLFTHYRAALQADGDAAGALRQTVRWLGPATAVALAASLAAAFWLAGSPAQARDWAFDEQRIEDLQAIGRAVDRYWKDHERLPDDLMALARTRDAGRLDLRDPVTGRQYDYTVVGERDYRLCAGFAAPSKPGDERFWRHGAARYCYELQAQP